MLRCPGPTTTAFRLAVLSSFTQLMPVKIPFKGKRCLTNFARESSVELLQVLADMFDQGSLLSYLERMSADAAQDTELL